MRVGIDLLFVKPKKSGGIESYIRNLLDGFLQYSPKDMEFYLFVSENNYDTFTKYQTDKRFILNKCPVNSDNVGKRIIWENIQLDYLAKKNNIDVMFMPVYSKPFITTSKIPYLTVIHDLQAMHYPKYFSIGKNLWLRFAWKLSAITSNKIIAISNFVKEDIVEKLKVNRDKIEVIYNPIVKSKKEVDFENLAKRFDLKYNEYFYTVSSMLPHKNLKTLLYALREIKQNNSISCNKLVISGVGGSHQKELLELIKELDIMENVIITGFISDEERDCLYKNARIFLFPSIFEGFGMPPIEAMMNGTDVITTRETSIEEITKLKATYVENSTDPHEWVEKIANIDIKKEIIEFDDYNLYSVTFKYINILKKLYMESGHSD